MRFTLWPAGWVARIEQLYSMRGRIGRRSLLYRFCSLGALGYLLIVLVFYASHQNQPNPPTASAWIATFLLLVPLGLGVPVLACAIAQRIQDIGLSSRFWPLGLMALPLLLLWPGQKRANKYGTPPQNAPEAKRQ